MLELLQERDTARQDEDEALRLRVREVLRSHLSALLPGTTVIVFGSLTRPHAFHSRSDIDLALECEPHRITRYGLTSELMERMGRPADVILLSESRLADKIRREGEAWTV
ncbi:MAG TPA: nucleotidyltransferase domain-containing protein [Oceanipulchritudo sp.]|nr:nucleotidyltransferase domain-containing protein [Oceanipulchritudo sp.]